MHLLLSVFKAAASIAITSNYNNIQRIVSAQLSAARSQEDPYTVALHKESITVGHIQWSVVHFHYILRHSGHNKVFHRIFLVIHTGACT